jgi:hypothetical protein
MATSLRDLVSHALKGTVLGAAIFAAGCGSAQPTRPTVEGDVTASLHADRQVTPAPYRAVASSRYTVHPLVDFQTTKAKLASDPKLAPLKEALANAGWNEDEQAAMVAIAGAYNQGGPADPARQRGLELRTAVVDGVAKLEQAIADREKATGRPVDRKALVEAVYAAPSVEPIQ